MRAFLNLRHSVPERRDAFIRGLQRHGFVVVDGCNASRVRDGDIFVTWNRIHDGQKTALKFEAMGLPVLVTENAAWGNGFCGGHWYTLARGYHNMAGCFPVGGAERWSALKVDLPPWRESGSEIVILPQRGIGPPGVAMPFEWTERVQKETGGRVRHHPGVKDCRPLEDDLKNARSVRTWGSGAAIKALLMGIPVLSDMPNWIGQQDNTDAGRLAMFRRLAWAQWRLSEIADGTAFARVLHR